MDEVEINLNGPIVLPSNSNETRDVSMGSARSPSIRGGEEISYKAGGTFMYVPIDDERAYKIIRPDGPIGLRGKRVWSLPMRKEIENVVEVQKIFFENGLSVECKNEVLEFKIIQWAEDGRTAKLFRTYGYETAIAKDSGEKIPAEKLRSYREKIDEISREYGIIISCPVSSRPGFGPWTWYLREVTQRKNIAYENENVLLVDIDRDVSFSSLPNLRKGRALGQRVKPGWKRRHHR